MSKVRMPFGKYKEDLLSHVPSSYLMWFVEQNGPADDPLLKRAMAMGILTRLMPHTQINPSRITGPNQRPASDPFGVFEEKVRPPDWKVARGRPWFSSAPGPRGATATWPCGSGRPGSASPP